MTRHALKAELTTATKERAADQRVAALIKRFGYDAVRALVEKQKPPEEPKRPGPNKLRYPIEKDLPWLKMANEGWAREGKLVNRVWPHLMKVGEEMESKVRPSASARSHVIRLAKRLETGSEILLLNHGLGEMARACGKGHWFPFGPFPDLSAQYREAWIKFHKKACTLLIDTANSLSTAHLVDEVFDLYDIVRRRENWREIASKY
jgi:hypothetical protein